MAENENNFEPEKESTYPALKAYLEKKKRTLGDGVTRGEYNKLVKEMEDAENQNSDENEGQGAPEDENADRNDSGEHEEEIVLENKGGDGRQDEEWVADLDGYWKKWCDEREYKYDRSDEDKAKPGLSFKYYTSEEDKASGKYAAAVHYTDKNHVKVKTKDDQSASLEFWRALAERANKDNQFINFAGIKKEENKAKLYVACVLSGVETSNVDAGKLNFEKAFKEMSEEDRKKAAQMLGLNENGSRPAPQNPNSNEGQNNPPVEEKSYASIRKGFEENIEKQQREYAAKNKGKGTTYKIPGETLPDGSETPEKEVEAFPDFKAKIDVSSFEKDEDKARAYLAAKVLGADVTGIDLGKVNVMQYISDLPKVDQVRLMVINKKETGFYHEKDSELDKEVEKRKGKRVAITEKVKNKEAGYEAGNDGLKNKRQGTKLSGEVLDRALNSLAGK